eukprot:COSAG02_NODE_2075_length_9928_cov_9.770272_9_plen_209_part_00
MSIMIVNELTVFASLTVRFLRGVCQVLRSAQRLTVSRPGFAGARQRIPLRSIAAFGGSPPSLRVGCAVLPWMASPARGGPASAGPYPTDALEPLLLELRGMDVRSAANPADAPSRLYGREAEVYFVSAAHGVCEHRVPPWSCTSCGSVLDTALCSCWRSFRDQCSWSLSPQDPRVWRLGPPLASPRTSLHQPDVPGFTVGSSLLRMDD